MRDTRTRVFSDYQYSGYREYRKLVDGSDSVVSLSVSWALLPRSDGGYFRLVEAFLERNTGRQNVDRHIYKLSNIHMRSRRRWSAEEETALADGVAR